MTTEARNRNGLICSLIPVRNGHIHRGKSIFYCSNRADYDCKKCNGICGPKDGCHCKSCEELTLLNKKKKKNAELRPVMVSFDTRVNRYRYFCLQKEVCDPIQLIQCRACNAMDPIPISIPKSLGSALNSKGLVTKKILVTSGHANRGSQVYYCGSTKVGYLCKKCDGTCGPTNGCNCFACSQLTAVNVQETRNGAGKKTHLSFDNVHTNSYRHYCGSFLNSANCGHCNPYCGPFNGCQCEYCKVMDPPVLSSEYQQQVPPSPNTVLTETFIILGDPSPTAGYRSPNIATPATLQATSVVSDRAFEVCKICSINPKNAVLIHGDTGHQFCCYECGKAFQRNKQPCPICAQEVVHVITVYKA